MKVSSKYLGMSLDNRMNENERVRKMNMMETLLCFHYDTTSIILVPRLENFVSFS